MGARTRPKNSRESGNDHVTTGVSPYESPPLSPSVFGDDFGKLPVTPKFPWAEKEVVILETWRK